MLVPDFSYLLWLLAYSFFLAALIYKTKTINTSISNSTYIFNIIVFMTAATAISFYYLINPIWIFSDESLFLTLIALGFQITNLGILFVITYLYYFSKKSKDKNYLILIYAGFLLQIIADSSYTYLSAIGSYQSGSLLDPIWLVALMLIALAGLFAQKNENQPKWEIKTYFHRKETIVPYASAVVLLILVLQSYQWELNALSIGFSVIFLMIIFRQLLILKKNNQLINEYRHLAYHDSLTGLNNRISFKEDLVQILVEAKQNNSSVALLLIGLDRFKTVNDTLGHYMGDQILKKASERLKDCPEVGKWIYRLGGDEFVIIVPETTETRCIVAAKIILKDFAKPFLVDNHQITISPSIGVSLSQVNGDNCDSLLKTADAAMHLAKVNGRNNFQLFDSALNQSMSRKIKIESELRKAIRKNQLMLFYQPIIELKTKQVIGMEALLRWEHPELGSISPDEFITIAEETGQIVAIGEWVLRKACHQNKLWQKANLPFLYVSVNVSVRQFQRSDFVKTVKTILKETELSPNYLQLEITESTMQNVKKSTEVLNKLSVIGIRTAIDDFGTGYSSLHILKEIPFNTIKIDKSFINDLTKAKNHAMVKTIIDIGLNLNLKVVAEGIENQHQARALTEYKCDYGQGYHFLKPVSAEDFEKFLQKDYYADKEYTYSKSHS